MDARGYIITITFIAALALLFIPSGSAASITEDCRLELTFLSEFERMFYLYL